MKDLCPAGDDSVTNSPLGGDIVCALLISLCTFVFLSATGAQCVNTDLSGRKSVITCQILQVKSFQLLFGSSESTFVSVIRLLREKRSPTLFLFCFVILSSLLFVPISLRIQPRLISLHLEFKRASHINYSWVHCINITYTRSDKIQDKEEKNKTTKNPDQHNETGKSTLPAFALEADKPHWKMCH